MKLRLGVILTVLTLVLAPLVMAQDSSAGSQQQPAASAPSTQDNAAQNDSTPKDATQQDPTRIDPTRKDPTKKDPTQEDATKTETKKESSSTEQPKPMQPLDLRIWPRGDAPSDSSNATAQPAQDSSQNGNSGPQHTFTHPETLPALAILEEPTSHNYIDLGVRLAAAWDSNAAAFAQTSYSQTLLTVEPSLQLRHTRPNFSWFINADGGIGDRTTKTPYNALNSVAGGGFAWQASRHWHLSAEDHYLFSFDPFTQYLVYTSDPTYNQPNPTIYVPQFTTQSNNASMSLTYAINDRNSVTFTGGEEFIRYLHSSFEQFNTFGYDGVALYQHLFSPRFSAGGGYIFRSYDFSHGMSRSGIQQMEMFARYQVNQHLTVSGYYSPERTATKELIVLGCIPPFGCLVEEKHDKAWSSAYGGSLLWRGTRDAFSIGGGNSIANGGILLGIVKLLDVDAQYSRMLTSRWSFSVGALYGNNAGYNIGGIGPFRPHLGSLVGSLGITRRLTSQISADLRYSRFYERQHHYPNAIAPKWTDNHFEFGLQYSWGRSLGW